jgi:hypothetical protein
MIAGSAWSDPRAREGCPGGEPLPFGLIILHAVVRLAGPIPPTLRRAGARRRQYVKLPPEVQQRLFVPGAFTKMLRCGMIDAAVWKPCYRGLMLRTEGGALVRSAGWDGDGR